MLIYLFLASLIGLYCWRRLQWRFTLYGLCLNVASLIIAVASIYSEPRLLHPAMDVFYPMYYHNMVTEIGRYTPDRADNGFIAGPFALKSAASASWYATTLIVTVLVRIVLYWIIEVL